MIDLNGSDFKGNDIVIFNDGKAGVAKNVVISVEKRGVGEPETYPEYKLIVEDDKGGKINQGFYYFTPNTQATDEYNKKRETQEVSRVLHVARAVMGVDYKFPEVTSAKQAVDVLFKLVADNVGSKKFNVFATYGTITRPNKKGYLGLRYFNFIEPATEASRFRVGAQDLMSRIEADAPSTDNTSSESTSTENWI